MRSSALWTFILAHCVCQFYHFYFCFNFFHLVSLFLRFFFVVSLTSARCKMNVSRNSVRYSVICMQTGKATVLERGVPCRMAYAGPMYYTFLNVTFGCCWNKKYGDSKAFDGTISELGGVSQQEKSIKSMNHLKFTWNAGTVKKRRKEKDRYRAGFGLRSPSACSSPSSNAFGKKKRNLREIFWILFLEAKFKWVLQIHARPK